MQRWIPKIFRRRNRLILIIDCWSQVLCKRRRLAMIPFCFWGEDKGRLYQMRQRRVGMGWEMGCSKLVPFWAWWVWVPVVWSNGSCYMDLELWGETRLSFGKPQFYHIPAKGILTLLNSFKTTSPFSLHFLGKIAIIVTWKNPHVVIYAHPID